VAQGFWQVLTTLQAPGTAIATSTTRTSMTVGSTQARFTLPANALKAPGDQLLVEASGIISTVAAANTETIDIALGTIANCSTGALPLVNGVSTNSPWALRMLMTAFTVGAGTAAQLRFTGYIIGYPFINTALPATGPGPGGNMIPYSGTATGATTLGTTFDSTVSNQVDIYATCSALTAGTTIQLLQYNLSLLTATGF
jgi:hypothetical protein